MDVMHIHRSKSRYQYGIGGIASYCGVEMAEAATMAVVQAAVAAAVAVAAAATVAVAVAMAALAVVAAAAATTNWIGGRNNGSRWWIFRIGIMDPWGIASSCRGRGDGGTGRGHGGRGGGGGGLDELDRRPRRTGSEAATTNWITVVDFSHRHLGSVGWPEASGRARYMALALTQDRSNHWGLIMTMLAGWRKTWQKKY